MALFAVLTFRYLPRSRRIQELVLTSSGRGYKSSNIESVNLIGKEGIVVKFLRPVGKIKIENIEYEAQSYGEFIEKETKIKISNIKNGKIIVRKA